MVHVSPDSRLLVSLVKQEQAYATQLHNLLNASATSLSALALYASSSPPTVSPVLNGVAGALSGASEALRKYGEGLNNWIDQLRTIKFKEDEVVNIGRDREILVTRLLKVSQKSKSAPQSLINAAPDSSSNVSFPSFSTKVTTAQSELQACEAHLAEKERELERVRMHAIREGLKVRCEALVQCGWMWEEMGQRALSMLEDLNGIPSPANGHASDFFKPFPVLTLDHDRDSNISSLTPSQSASQIGVMPHTVSPLSQEKSIRLNIPPPHLISEETAIPTSSLYPAGGMREDLNSSSEDEGPVEVHENPRFQPASTQNSQKSAKKMPSILSRGSHIPFPSPSKSHDSSSEVVPSMSSAGGNNVRHRKGTGLFGSIALLFKTSMSGKPISSHIDGHWNTRTDRNLRRAKTDDEESSGDEVQPRSGRLKKGKVRSTTGVNGGRGGAVLTGVGPTQLSAPPPTPADPPARVKRKASGGKWGRSGTVRSTISEPGPSPRVRATTLTGSTTGGRSHGSEEAHHGRAASIDGRRGSGHARSSSGSSLHGPPASSPAWKPPNETAAAKRESLMSIVAGVSHSNQHDDPSSKLEVVRAPVNTVSGPSLLVNHPPPLPEMASSSGPAVHTSATSKRSSMPNPPASRFSTLPVAEKKPLRSAMRSPNGVSPSSSLRANAKEVDSETLSPRMSPLSLPAPALPSQRPTSMTRPEIPSTIMESPRHSFVMSTEPQTDSRGGQSIVDATSLQADPRRQSSVSTKTDDSASISSYATGREDFDGEGSEPETLSAPGPSSGSKVEPTLQTVPQPSHPTSSIPAPNGTAEPVALDTHEVASVTSEDTATGGTITRRKSVRMSSLPPQVSATPPALDEYEYQDRAPWNEPLGQASARGEGWKMRIPAASIAWADSSSEEEDYKAARKALSLVAPSLGRKNR